MNIVSHCNGFVKCYNSLPTPIPITVIAESLKNAYRLWDSTVHEDGETIEAGVQIIATGKKEIPPTIEVIATEKKDTLPKLPRNTKRCSKRKEMDKEKEEGKERLFALPKAAKYLGRTVWSMRHLAGRGSIPCVRDGKRIFFDVNDLDKYIERNRTSERVLSQVHKKEKRK